MTPALYEYLLKISVREHPVLKALREETASMALAGMQISPDEAQFIPFLLQCIKARRVLELGTFTGYSALAMALVLPEDGELITCDINSEWTRVAQPYWEKAAQAHKISLRLAPAMDTLNALLPEYKHRFDAIFIDADKTNYCNYYELALQLIHPDGVILIDNIFWEGQVIDESIQGGQTKEIRRLNERITHDDRVDVSLLGIADGLFLIKPKTSFSATW